MPNVPRFAAWLRKIADRIDDDGAPRLIGWSFTFETGEGIRFRNDGKGCPLAYLAADDYERAHSEADSNQPDPHREAVERFLRDALGEKGGDHG